MTNTKSNAVSIMDEIEKIKNELYDLEQLKFAFSTVGNRHVSETLHYVIESINKSLEKIQSSTCKESQERFEAAQQSSANIFKAVLAGRGVEIK